MYGRNVAHTVGLRSLKLYTVIIINFFGRGLSGGTLVWRTLAYTSESIGFDPRELKDFLFL